MFTLIALFIVLVSITPAFAQEIVREEIVTTPVPTLTVLGAEADSKVIYKIFLFGHGGPCPSTVSFSTDAEAEQIGISAFYSIQPADQTFPNPPMDEVYSLGTYWFNPTSKVYEYIITSCGYDLPHQLVMTYTPVLKLPDPPVVVAPTPPQPTWSVAVTGGAAIQPGQTLPGLMVRGSYRALDYVRFIGGIGLEGVSVPTEFASPRGVVELGVGGGITTAIPGTKLTFDGLLALGGGIRPFRVMCGPEAYDPSITYTCGHDGAFPVVFSGPWFGAQAHLGVLGPIKAKHIKNARIGGQIVVTAPVHVGSNSWPKYQEVDGRTITVHTTDGDKDIPYQWAGGTFVLAYPVVSAGVVVMF